MIVVVVSFFALTEFLCSSLKTQSCGWFQHDVSASHTTDHSLTALEEVFGAVANG